MQRNTTQDNSTIDMAHLDKLPTYFVKGDDRRAVYFTVIASELLAEGFVEEQDDAVPTTKAEARPETPVVAGKDAYVVDPFEEEFEDELEADSVSLEEFTKAELIDYAKSLGTEVKPSLSKSDILEICINLSK
jgi:hypothetical protein